MGFFDKLFGKDDPAHEWVAVDGVTNELDLDRMAVCGIGLGDRVEQIAKLGPPANPKPTKYGLYVYKPRGVVIESEDGVVSTFVIAFDAAAPSIRTDAFCGAIRHRGKVVTLGQQTAEPTIIEQFGEPFWRDAEDEDVVLYYEFADGVEWQVEFSEEGRLSVLIITTKPLLADDDARRSLGVTRPWPPA